MPEDDEGKQQVQPIEEVKSTEAESRLEDLLVQEPDMLMPGLELVGRQTSTGGRPFGPAGGGRWHQFEKFLRRRKRVLGAEIFGRTGGGKEKTPNRSEPGLMCDVQRGEPY